MIFNREHVILIIKKYIWHAGKALFYCIPMSQTARERFYQIVSPLFTSALKDGTEAVDIAVSDYKDNITKMLQQEYNSEIDHYIPFHNNPSLSNEIVKVIAFYLPQFHSIPENDEWWGNGFTEWTNVKPAKPQFKGHYQPHIPGELGYYNLLDIHVQEQQVRLAKNYGIGGFCFHFYWFNGVRLLEKPIENYLSNPQLDLPFCISWANENWTRRWDGRDNEILIGQKHSPEDDIDFISHVSKYMQDKRYIRIDGKPLLLIYRSELLPSALETAQRWRKWCIRNGTGEIYLVNVQSFLRTNPLVFGFDAAVEFPPNNFNPLNVTHLIKPDSKNFKGTIFDLRSVKKFSDNSSLPDYKLFRCVCPSWDNTPRRKNESIIYINNQVEDFKEWIYKVSMDTCKKYKNQNERLVFVNAWNEWAESAYLEPDQKYGYAYLQSIYDVLQRLVYDYHQEITALKPETDSPLSHVTIRKTKYDI
jgi:hypothetical protein